MASRLRHRGRIFPAARYDRGIFYLAPSAPLSESRRPEAAKAMEPTSFPFGRLSGPLSRGVGFRAPHGRRALPPAHGGARGWSPARGPWAVPFLACFLARQRPSSWAHPPAHLGAGERGLRAPSGPGHPGAGTFRPWLPQSPTETGRVGLHGRRSPRRARLSPARLATGCGFLETTDLAITKKK